MSYDGKVERGPGRGVGGTERSRCFPTANPSKRKRNETIKNQSHRRRSSAAMLGVGLVRSLAALAGAVVPCRLLAALRGRKSGNCRHGQLAIALAESSSRACHSAPWHPRHAHAHAQQLHQPERLPRIPQPALTMSPRPRLASPVSRAGRWQGGGQASPVLRTSIQTGLTDRRRLPCPRWLPGP